MVALAARLKTFSGMQSISRIHTEKLRLQPRLQAAAPTVAAFRRLPLSHAHLPEEPGIFEKTRLCNLLTAGRHFQR